MRVEDTIQKGLAAINAHDVNAFAANYADGTTVVDPQWPEPLKGRAAVMADMEAFIKGIPDLQASLKTLLTDSDTYAAEFAMTGTHKGPLAGPEGDIPPTNKPVRLNMSTFGRVGEDGNIVEERRYFDLAGLFAQIAGE